MTTTVFIPRDTTALSMGADDVVQALKFQSKAITDDITIVRNGSRGLFYLEPLVEVMTPKGRVAYGPVQVEDVESLLAQGLLDGNSDHPLYLGFTEEIPFLAKQQRLTFIRAGIIDPTNIDEYIDHSGFSGLTNAFAMLDQDNDNGRQAIVDEIKTSGLRGRGGAAFPAGIKWQTVLDAKAKAPEQQKYIVCNADEGDSGTFSDRLLMEADPFCLIEGMIIAGLAVGASQGYIYLRSEYPQAKNILEQAITIAYQQHYLGKDIQQSGQTFDLEVRIGAGAYICGEETSLLESLEGKRGLVRAKPPLPAIEGLFGQPTIVNNVISLASVPIIMEKGAQYYQDFGVGRSRGTLPFQLAGNIKQGGLVELAFGTSLADLVNDFGAGSYSGKPIKAIQVGGPLGAYLPEHQWPTELDYEAFAKMEAVLGHGGIVVFDDSVDMTAQARFAMEFCVAESCGKCTPCRIGSVRGVEVIDKMTKTHQERSEKSTEQLAELNTLLVDLCDTMTDGSLCAMGGMTPIPVRSILNHFSDDFVATTDKFNVKETN
ncbi:NADH-ubiquinone oxidoreductase-F iron-sulfur binding region domain-containing protein [Thalassotalea psychrophila]|uniref:NADH-quinone oxidoreductase subunit F n=1 Tax=Thalassotalea psychrophila TaxID=3065647 RepID=A0ABY9TV29_9GAMM|nr:NADH-ubiquinone oxidoreductase-F iron-sulfur binding region domain-containing protein [Colwelliaceae bacterium SQ149]